LRIRIGRRNSFLVTETAFRDRKRKLMPDGPYRGFAIRLEGYGQRGPGAPGRTRASCGPPGDDPSRATAAARPGLPVVPPDLTVRGLPPLRTRSVRARAAPGASHEPLCSVAARLRAPRGQRAVSRLLAAAGTPGHFPSRRNEAIPGPCSPISRIEKPASGKDARPQHGLANMRRVITGNPFWRGPARPANDGKSFARWRARWPTPAGRPGAAGPARLRGRRAGIRDN
jgi:hypothetical protein